MLVVSCVGVRVSKERCARSEEKKNKLRDALFLYKIVVLAKSQGFFAVCNNKLNI